MDSSNETLKIAQSVDIFYPSIDGVVKVVDNYATHLNSHGNTICCVYAPQVKLRYTDNRPYAVYRLPGILFIKGVALTVPFLSRKPRKAFNMLMPDIVHSHSPFIVGSYTYKLARKNHIPYLMTFHSKYRDDFKRLFMFDIFANLATRIVMRLYNKADYVWTVSAGAAEVLRSYGYKGNITIMENGIDFYPPSDLEPLKELAAKKYGLNTSDKIITFVGRISAQKNIYLLLDAFKLIAQDGYRLLLVGVREEMIAVQIYAAKSGILPYITFTGVVKDQNELMGLYALSKLFFFPSTYDTFALVVHEAASVFVPSLVPEGSCAAGGIIDGYNGFTCKLTAEAAASKIREIFSNEEKLKTAGINARTTLYKTWDEKIPGIVEQYKEIIKDYKRKHPS